VTASTVAKLLAEHHALELTVEGRAAGGEVGAYFGRRPNGRRIVFKWFERPEWAEDLTRTLVGLERLRDKGYPIPEHEPLIVIPGALVVIQEWIDRGAIVDQITHRMLDRVLELNELQAGEGDYCDNWSAFIVGTLTVGADGWCLHEPLRQHDRRTGVIVDHIEGIGASLIGQEMPHADIAHMDFHHRNLLQDSNGIVAVIDWEGSMPGDRIFDLVTLGFCAAVAQTERGVEDRIWKHVEREGDPAAVAAYVCQMAVRRLDWTIRHHPDEVVYWTERSEQLLADFA